MRNLTYTKTQVNKRFVQSNGGVKMFAAVEADGFATNIRESAGPVDSISKQGTGEYRITFTRNFMPSDGNIFAQCTGVSTAGSTCSWSYNGTSVNSIDVSARSSGGAAADVVFSLVVWVPA